MSAASRRRIAALLTALTAFVLQPGTPGRAGLSDSSNPNCPAANALPAITNQAIDLKAGLQCFEPGSTSFGGNVVVPPTTHITRAAPQPGQSCQDIYYHPVTFSEDTSQSGDLTAHFTDLGGASTGQQSGFDAANVAGSNAYMADTLLGTYELTNPNDPASLQCVLEPAAQFHFYCPTTGAIDSLCFVWQDNPFVVKDPPATVPPFFANVLGNLNVPAGTVHSAPATKGLVNTPVCFWIEGMAPQAERRLTLVLPGPIDPSGSGRQVFFTYFADIQFQGVTWDFDELSHDNSQAPVPAECQQPGRDQLVAHQYSQISDLRGNADNTYHVVATEHYSISVTVYWYDSSGPEPPRRVDPGVADPTLTAGPYQQYVGQVEGVPIGGQ
jgi:hypothetical protein